MTTFWPKRDEDGRHETDDKGQRVIIGECGGPELQQDPPKCDKCYDCGYTIDDDLYATQCDCGAHELP